LIGVFDASTAFAIFGMLGFPKQECRTACRLTSSHPTALSCAALPPRSTPVPPRLVIASSQARLLTRTESTGAERVPKAIQMLRRDAQMSGKVHERFVEQTSLSVPGRPVMVYMCECGMKWTNSLRPTWECKCGRYLEKRNGIIHAAIRQRSARTERIARVFIVANG
jgi:hypothetical protein